MSRVGSATVIDLTQDLSDDEGSFEPEASQPARAGGPRIVGVGDGDGIVEDLKRLADAFKDEEAQKEARIARAQEEIEKRHRDAMDSVEHDEVHKRRKVDELQAAAKERVAKAHAFDGLQMVLYRAPKVEVSPDARALVARVPVAAAAAGAGSPPLHVNINMMQGRNIVAMQGVQGHGQVQMQVGGVGRGRGRGRGRGEVRGRGNYINLGDLAAPHLGPMAYDDTPYLRRPVTSEDTDANYPLVAVKGRQVAVNGSQQPQLRPEFPFAPEHHWAARDFQFSRKRLFLNLPFSVTVEEVQHQYSHFVRTVKGEITSCDRIYNTNVETIDQVTGKYVTSWIPYVYVNQCGARLLAERWNWWPYHARRGEEGALQHVVFDLVH
jgi:hypothetical protein